MVHHFPVDRYLPLGIGLCYLGKQDAAEATMAALEVARLHIYKKSRNYLKYLHETTYR